MNMNLSKLWEMVKNREIWCAAFHGVTKSWTRLSDWTTTTRTYPFLLGCPNCCHVIICSILLCISVILVMTSFLFLISFIWAFFLFLLMSLAKGFISFIYLFKKQLLVSLSSLFVSVSHSLSLSLVSSSFIYTLIFIFFLLLTLDFDYSTSSKDKAKLFIWVFCLFVCFMTQAHIFTNFLESLLLYFIHFRKIFLFSLISMNSFISSDFFTYPLAFYW